MSTTTLTQPLRDEHRELLPHIEALRAAADLSGVASPDRLSAAVDEANEFLVEHLIPHATAEDAALYPVVEEGMRAPGATDTMRRDHVEVVRLTESLELLRAQMDSSPDADHERRLRAVLYGLYAIVSLHFAKEEEIYLPVLDRWLDGETAERMFAEMETAAAAAKSRAAVAPR